MSLQSKLTLGEETAAFPLSEQMDLSQASFLQCNPHCSSDLQDVKDKSARWASHEAKQYGVSGQVTSRTSFEDSVGLTGVKDRRELH